MKPSTHVTTGRDDPTGGNRGFEVLDLVVRDVAAVGRPGTRTSTSKVSLSRTTRGRTSACSWKPTPPGR